MPNSGTVTAGSVALASQYNNLRDDVLNVSTGHTHTGASENGAKVAATGVSSGTAALGAVLTADGSGAAAFLASSSGGILKYQEFTSSGSFVIPTGASSSAVMILNVVGAGAGGNSGARTGAGTSAAGGGGGVGGGVGEFVFLASAFGTPGGTVTVTIGAGGAGGASKTTVGVGNLGSEGGTTSFGTVNFKGGGVPSTAIGVRANYRFDANIFQIVGSTPTQSTASGTSLPDTTGKKIINDLIAGIRYSFGSRGIGDNAYYSSWDTVGIAAGGGGGGGVGYLGTAARGGNGGKVYDSASDSLTTDNHYEPYFKFGNGATGGTVAGAAGSNVASGLLDGAGGGAGGAAGSAGSGGNGAIGGGGGGGGGGLAQNSGAGGTGGSGRVRVWVIG